MWRDSTVSYTPPFRHGGKIIELGGGDHPYFRPSADRRKLPTVDIMCDLEKPFPMESESYDGVFSHFLLEHISWRNIRLHLSEMCRILKPGGIAVCITANTKAQATKIAALPTWKGDEENALIFGGQDFPDNFHKCAFSPEYATRLFKEAGFSEVKIVQHPCPTDLIIEGYKGGENVRREPFERIKQSEWYRELGAKLEGKPATTSAKGLKLNIGSFTVMIPGFMNIDILDLSKYAKEKGFNFQQVDVRKGIPFEDSSVEQINCSHLLEHFEIETEGKPFLRECRRVLKQNGILRIGVPDLRKIINTYLKGEMDKVYRSKSLNHPAQPEEYLKSPSQADKFWRILTSDHKTCYDLDALKKILSLAGFQDVKEVPYDKELDMFPELSLYVSATKTQETGSEPPYRQYLEGKIKEGMQ